MTLKSLVRHLIIYGNLAAIFRYVRNLKRFNNAIEKDANEFEKERSYTHYKRARWAVLFGRPISKNQEDKLEQIHEELVAEGFDEPAAKQVGRRLMLGRHIDFESGQIKPKKLINVILAAITLFLATLCLIFLSGMIIDLIQMDAPVTIILAVTLIYGLILGVPVTFFLYMAFAPLTAIYKVRKLGIMK
jgi:hypothetical protein